MKTALGRAIRDETGTILITVLILLVVGGLVLAPLLGLMSTGLASGRVYEKKLAELYAADAGVEDAKWHLQDDSRLAARFGPTGVADWTVDEIVWPRDYRLDNAVNQMQVHVEVDVIWLLKGLGYGLPEDPPALDDRWTVAGAINIAHPANYVVDITTTANATMGHIGVWLPLGYDYRDGSTQINGIGVDDQRVANPHRIPHQGGLALIWSFDGMSFEDVSGILPASTGGCQPATKFPHTVRLSFDYANTRMSQEGGSAEARGFFPWISCTTLAASHLAWDSEAGVYHIRSQAASDLQSSVGTTIESYVLRSVGRYTMSGGGAASTVRGDFIAIGNTLMTNAWLSKIRSSCSNYEYQNAVVDPSYSGTYYVDTCQNIRGSHWSESAATIDGNDVPADARIEKAYLYWTAWWWTNGADEEVTLRVAPAGGEERTAIVQADKSYIMETTMAGGYQYSCVADVTDHVTRATTAARGTTFTVGSVSAVPAPYAKRGELWLTQANAGWSMVIIYSSAEKEARQIYLYHDMALGLRFDSVTFTVTGFRAPNLTEGDMGAQVAVFVAEGDAHLKPTYIRFKGESGGFHYLGDSDTEAANPYNNVFNGYSTATGFVPSPLPGQAPREISGVDIDVYTKDKNGRSLSDIIRPGDTKATIRLETERDFIMLVYVVFSVRSNAVPPGEGVHIGTMTYSIG